MTQRNVFLKPKDGYSRNVYPHRHYIEQQAFYLSRMTGDAIEVCREWLTGEIKDKRFPEQRDPITTFYERDDTGDRSKHETTLSSYIYSAISQQYIMAPTFTCYLNPTQKASTLVGFVVENTRRRGIAKKAALKAKADGQRELYIVKDNEQANRKRYINSLSGIFGSKGSLVKNMTSHNTLTSTIRSVSSISNTSNERLIAGNRLYHNPESVLSNILSIVTNTDYGVLSTTMTQYGLHYPSVKDVLECVTRSSDLYWRDREALSSIEDFVGRLNDLERAAFVYTGDLYHLRKHNDEVMRVLIHRLASRDPIGQHPDPLAYIRTVNEDILNLAHQICSDDVKGLGKRYEEMLELGVLNRLAAVCQNIDQTLSDYAVFFEAFFLTTNIPPDIAYVADMVRRTVVLSDTDSTCFSVDDWVQWSFGEIVFNPESIAVAASVAFIATQCMSHLLALLSANMNVEKERLHTLAMKNEFSWAVHANTSVAKHYYALTTVQEGSVYTTPEMDIKGVHLKNSALPREIVSLSRTMMEDILTTVSDNRRLSLRQYQDQIVELEQQMYRSLLAGELQYFKNDTIKELSAYAKPEASNPFNFHELWQDVFADKYGSVGEPPYDTLKIPTTLESPTRLKTWVASITDRNISTKLGGWLTRHRKDKLPTLYFSSEHIQGSGIPEEVRLIVNHKKVILDLCNVFYIILESLGYFKKEDMTLTESLGLTFSASE